jgi:uncharacterized membrane protein
MALRERATESLKNHPRLVAAVFTALLVLSQAGMVAAEGSAGAGYHGP